MSFATVVLAPKRRRTANDDHQHMGNVWRDGRSGSGRSQDNVDTPDVGVKEGGRREQPKPAPNYTVQGRSP